MLSLHNIRSIALYETKTLFRSWFFRIFAIVALLVMLGFNMVCIRFWSYKSSPAMIPWCNLVFLNVVQAIIAVFLASDFLKRDKKLDTTEVIYIRPMTNAEYVIGKLLGNLVVFFVLNLLILGMGLIFNSIAQHTYIEWAAYLYYFLLMSLPTLIYIFGLSFFVMSLIRNQAVTFIILLGYIAITLFYLKSNLYYLFDYMSFHVPMFYSDITGFGELNKLLVHRGLYLMLGMSLVCFTIAMLQRLPNASGSPKKAAVCGLLFFVAAAWLGYRHVSASLDDYRLRAQMQTLNDSYADVKTVDVTDYNLDVTHSGSTLTITAVLDVENTDDIPLPKLVFSLNPGLTLTGVMDGEKPLDFERKLNIIELAVELQPAETRRLTFTYAGTINEAACFLDATDEMLKEKYTTAQRSSPAATYYSVNKRYAFVMPDYVLLTREANWYPIPGGAASFKNPQWFMRQFSNYSLKVSTAPGLTTISQGMREIAADSTSVKFTSSTPMTQISLIVGNYQQMAQTVDGLDFSIYVYKGHDYFSEFFEEIRDTVPTILTEVLQDFERNIDMYYPFSRFSLVEVPLPFYSYERVLTGLREQIQPEMILFPEKGAIVENADFFGRYDMMSGGMMGPGGGGGPFGGRGNQSMTTEEKKLQILRNFFSTFTRKEGQTTFAGGNFGQVTVSQQSNPMYAFPMFYDLSCFIRSDKWPVTDRVFEAYKMQAVSSGGFGGFQRDVQGMSTNEQGNVALMSQSLEEIINDPEKRSIVNTVLQQKGLALFSIVKQKTDDEEFASFLYNFLSKNKFKVSTLAAFDDSINARFKVELTPYMEQWFRSKELPAFIIGNVNAVKVLDGEEIKTMVKFKITNTERAEGIVSAEFRTGGGRGGGGGGGGAPTTTTRWIFLEGGQTKDASFLLSGTPFGLSLNTYTSKNIPSQMSFPLGDVPEDNKATPLDTLLVSDTPVSLSEENEIIIDNEDPGFVVAEQQEASPLRRWLLQNAEQSTSKYSGFTRWRPPRQWTLTTNTSFYGSYVRSAYYIRNGSGDKKVTWNLAPAEAGYYEVWVYVFKEMRNMVMRGPGGGGGGPGGSGRNNNNNAGEYHYIIHHGSGTEERSVELQQADLGWNKLGTYYFTPEAASVDMTDQSSNGVVVADAVKFIKQK